MIFEQKMCVYVYEDERLLCMCVCVCACDFVIVSKTHYVRHVSYHFTISIKVPFVFRRRNRKCFSLFLCWSWSVVFILWSGVAFSRQTEYSRAHTYTSTQSVKQSPKISMHNKTTKNNKLTGEEKKILNSVLLSLFSLTRVKSRRVRETMLQYFWKPMINVCTLSDERVIFHNSQMN